MRRILPPMSLVPEKTQSMAGIAYSCIAFFTLPFLALYFSQGFSNAASLSWFEIIFHGLNFCVAVRIFRSYLQDSFLDVQCDLKIFLSAVAECTLLVIAYTILFPRFIYQHLPEEDFWLAVAGLPPMLEVELFNTTSNLVLINPVFGTTCVVLLGPVTISCLYYASGFAPVCSNRPWLAYIVIALVLMIPRICNAITGWPFRDEVILYLVQLPVHLIACTAYHKTDIVWTPIAIHTAVNLIGCINLLAQR